MERVEVWGVYPSQRPAPIQYVSGERPEGYDIRSLGGVEHLGHYEEMPDGSWRYVRDNYRPMCGQPPVFWQRDHCPGEWGGTTAPFA